MSKVFCKKCGSNVKNGRCTDCGMIYVMHDRSRELDQIFVFQGRTAIPNVEPQKERKTDAYGVKMDKAPNLPKQENEILHQNRDDEKRKIKNDDVDHSKEKKNRLQQWLLPAAAACALLTAVIFVCIITTGSSSKEHDAEVIAVITPTGGTIEAESIASIPVIDMDNTINSGAADHQNTSSDNTLQPTSQITPEPYESPEATPELPDLGSESSREDHEKNEASTGEKSAFMDPVFPEATNRIPEEDIWQEEVSTDKELLVPTPKLPETTDNSLQKVTEQIETDVDENPAMATPETTNLINEVPQEMIGRTEASEDDESPAATPKLPETTGEFSQEKIGQVEIVVDEKLTTAPLNFRNRLTRFRRKKSSE